MSLGPFASHPRDVIARSTAHDATADTLTARFEEIIASDQSMAWRYGALQVLCSQAIARVRLDERSNVIPLRAPATQERPGA